MTELQAPSGQATHKAHVVIFGGTTEGRVLCELCEQHELPALCCVATQEGARAVERLAYVSVSAKRLDEQAMTALLKETSPRLVVDATHPYAVDASSTIAAACMRASLPLLRVEREREQEQETHESCLAFDNTNTLLAWLEEQEGVIFSTCGSSYAKLFTQLTNFQERVWMRVLPSTESIQSCLDAGYRPDHLVAMQGPFSERLNRALFETAGARILVTKNSGKAGGFSEKLKAAESLDMRTAVMLRKDDTASLTAEKYQSCASLEEASRQIVELLT